MSSDDHKSHVLMIFNQVTSYVEDVLKSYILNEILLVATSILKSSLSAPCKGDSTSLLPTKEVQPSYALTGISSTPCTSRRLNLLAPYQ